VQQHGVRFARFARSSGLSNEIPKKKKAKKKHLPAKIQVRKIQPLTGFGSI